MLQDAIRDKQTPIGLQLTYGLLDTSNSSSSGQLQPILDQSVNHTVYMQVKKVIFIATFATAVAMQKSYSIFILLAHSITPLIIFL